MTVIALAWNNAELERRIANFLCQRRVPGGECIQLNVYGGVVAVSGRIPTRYAKWLCIECCRRVAGVIRVIDNVKIEPAKRTANGGSYRCGKHKLPATSIRQIRYLSRSAKRSV